MQLNAGEGQAVSTWDALHAAHGKQLGAYEIAEADRVITCPCGEAFAPDQSAPCQVCGSPLCPVCDRAALLSAAPAVCAHCRDGQLLCDRCGATVGIVGGRVPEGWATSPSLTLCPRCLGDEGQGVGAQGD